MYKHQYERFTRVLYPSRREYGTMVRVFVTVFLVFTVSGVTVAGGAVGTAPSRSLSSVGDQDTAGHTIEMGRQMNAQGNVRSATGTESRIGNIPRPWLIGSVVLVFVLILGGVAYRNSIKTRTSDETDTITSTITEEDLLSDDDRVLLLLQDNEGRMKQANIVHETGWSKSKVSVVLSEMDDEDLISKLPIGRENIICITGDEPEAARSPFEDEN